MKKLIPVFCIAMVVIFVSTSCKKTAKLIFPGVDFDLPAVVIPLDTLPAPFQYPINTAFDLPPINQKIKMDSIVRERTGNNFGEGDINSIKLKQIRLRLVEGYDANNKLSNFNFAEFKISNHSNPLELNDAPQVVANANFAGADSVKVVATPDSPELVGYVRNGDLWYHINASLNKAPTKKLKFEVVASMRME